MEEKKVLLKKVVWQNKNRIAPPHITSKKFEVVKGVATMPAKEAEMLVAQDGFNWKFLEDVVDAGIATSMSDDEFINMTDAELQNTTKNVLIEKVKALNLDIKVDRLSKPKILEAIQNALNGDGEGEL